jgi:hypothetical protein
MSGTNPPGWAGKQIAALTEKQARKQHMDDDGVDYASPAEREAWEAGHITERECSYCRRGITLDASVQDSAWVDDWYDADCPASPDGMHAPDEETKGEKDTEPARSLADIAMTDALAVVDAVKSADTGFLYTSARNYGADSVPAANLLELLALRKLAEAVRTLRLTDEEN